jgi:hypothetical protein
MILKSKGENETQEQYVFFIIAGKLRAGEKTNREKRA